MAGDLPLKPDGRIISRAAAQWHIAPENILVVGDTINDLNFAHNGGAIAVGVLSGVSSRKQLAPAADYMLEDVYKRQEKPPEVRACSLMNEAEITTISGSTKQAHIRKKKIYRKMLNARLRLILG